MGFLLPSPFFNTMKSGWQFPRVAYDRCSFLPFSLSDPPKVPSPWRAKRGNMVYQPDLSLPPPFFRKRPAPFRPDCQISVSHDGTFYFFFSVGPLLRHRRDPLPSPPSSLLLERYFPLSDFLTLLLFLPSLTKQEMGPFHPPPLSLTQKKMKVGTSSHTFG